MKGELLLIEDSENTRVIIQKILERQEYQLHTANDGAQGIKRIEELRPKLVLLDISLPEMDGMEVARRVRGHPEDEVRDTVLVALTAMATPGDRDRFFDAGCDDHLPKPFRAAQLVEIVDMYMAAEFVAGETPTPGQRRRERLKEIAALRTQTEPEVQSRPSAATSGQAAEKKPPSPSEKPAKAEPKKTSPSDSKPAAKGFSIEDDFLSEFLDPGTVEPTDPSDREN
jgi:CheY-like chemotaxis protein